MTSRILGCIAVCILALQGCESTTPIPKEEPIQTHYDSGELESEYVVVDGKVDGVYQSYYKNGQIKFARNYQQNRLHGHSKLYTSTGQLISDSYYKHDQLESVTLYDKKNRLHSFYSYQNGKQNGPFQTYHINGRVKMTGQMMDDKFEGDIVIRNDRGVRRKRKSYVGGILNGKTIYFDETGQELCEVTYRDGIPSGDYYIYKPNLTLAGCINYQ